MEDQIGGKLTPYEKDLQDFDMKMLARTFRLRENSFATKRQVGAIIVNMEIGKEMIISTGYNTMYDRLVKEGYSCENSEGKSYECVIHAEEKAILDMFKTNFKEVWNDKKTIYITYSPCINCCKLIVSAGIKRVVYCEEHEKNFNTPKIMNGFSPKGFLLEMGVELHKFEIGPITRQKSEDCDDEVCYELLNRINGYSKEEIKPIIMEIKIALVYHSADNDGLMSGYLLKTPYLKEIASGEAILIPYNYGLEDEWLFDKTFTDYIFVDITPPLNWLSENIERLTDNVPHIIIYDHHKPKMEEIQIGYLSHIGKTIIYNFDENKSGCKIFYDNYKNSLQSDKLTLLVELISDYDLWNFDKKHYNSIKFKNNFYGISDVLSFAIYMQQFKTLEEFILEIDYILQHSNFEFMLDKDLKIGEIIINKIKSDNSSILKNGYYFDHLDTFYYQGYPNYFLQQELIKKYPEIKYWISFDVKLEKQQVTFSIRSKTQFDCHLMAKHFGGGGHSQAAGFKQKLADGVGLIHNMMIINQYNQ